MATRGSSSPTASRPAPLVREGDEDFTKLTRARNSSPRGIWSDGDVMYVVDANDDKIYSYNMPDAADARLASLTLTHVDLGEFSPERRVYTGILSEGARETVIDASAVQSRAMCRNRAHRRGRRPGERPPGGGG